MTRLALTLVCAAGVALAAAQATAQNSKAKGQADGPIQIASLDGVTWEGAGARLDQLKGKTVVVLTYVTWCPICNKWVSVETGGRHG